MVVVSREAMAQPTTGIGAADHSYCITLYPAPPPQNTGPLTRGTNVGLTGLHKPTDTMDDQKAETPAVPSGAAASSTAPWGWRPGDTDLMMAAKRDKDMILPARLARFQKARPTAVLPDQR